MTDFFGSLFGAYGALISAKGASCNKMRVDVLDLSQKLSDAASYEQQLSVLMETVNRYGYEFFSFGMFYETNDGSFASLDVEEMPEDWTAYYNENELYKDDPRVIQSARTGQAILWSEAIQAADRGDLTDRASIAATSGRDFGILDGVTIPLSTVPGLMSGVCFTAKGKTFQKDHDRLVIEYADELRIIGHLFEAHIDPRACAVRHFNLSRRQLDVLRWLADGLRQDAIADRLGIHVSVAHRHIVAAQDRLGATTPAQAVARAVRFGLC